MILGGVLGYTLSYLFENVGLALSTASEISLMMGVFPVLSLLVEGLAYHRRFSHATVAGIALFGSIALLPLAGVFKRPAFPVPAATVWAVIYLAVFCSVGGYSLYNYGVSRMTSNQAVNILNLIPVFGVLTSWVVLHETVTVMQLGGGAVVLLGVLLSLRDSSPLASPS